MKFGKKMIAAMRPEWGPHVYVAYESLKQTLTAVADAETSAHAEGAFVEQLMQCIQQAPSPPHCPASAALTPVHPRPVEFHLHAVCAQPRIRHNPHTPFIRRLEVRAPGGRGGRR